MSRRETRSALFELALARFREFFRQPEAVFWSFGFPILLSLALGVAFREGEPELPRIGIAADEPAWLGELLAGADDALQVETLAEDELTRALRTGRVDVVVSARGETEVGTEAETEAATEAETETAAETAAESESETETETETETEAETAADPDRDPDPDRDRGSAPDSAGRLVTYRFDAIRPGALAARLAADAVLQESAGRADVLPTADEQVTEPGGRYIDFLYPGILGMNLMGSSMWGIGFSIVLARKQRLLKRLAATPMRRGDFLAAVFLSRLLFLVIEVVVLLTFGSLAFDVAIGGSALALAGVALLGAASFAGLSLVIAARVSTVEAAAGWMNLVMLPMWLLSGTFFSYERFPEVVHPAIRALPLTALNDGLRALMNEGASLASIGVELGVLAGWGTVGFVVAMRVFRWQ